MFDLSDGFAHRGLSFEPELVYERRSQGGWRYSASVGAIVADHKLASTFYQVTALHLDALQRTRPGLTLQLGCQLAMRRAHWPSG